jgi:DNA mismatch repair protein MutS2
MGSPGSSFTFEVAKINGVPESLIEKAKKKLNKEKLRFNELLSDLQGKTNLLEKQIKEHKKEAGEYRDKAEHIETYKEKLQSKYDKLNQPNQVHDTQLLAGKKMLEFISQYKTGKGKKINEEISEKIIAYLKEQKTKTEAKKKAKKPKRKLSKKQVMSYRQDKIIVGSKVKIISTKQQATVDEIKGSQTTLIIGNTRIKVALDQLIYVS